MRTKKKILHTLSQYIANIAAHIGNILRRALYCQYIAVLPNYRILAIYCQYIAILPIYCHIFDGLLYDIRSIYVKIDIPIVIQLQYHDNMNICIR